MKKRKKARKKSSARRKRCEICDVKIRSKSLVLPICPMCMKSRLKEKVVV